MKRICLIGPVDKRAIAYPLIRCGMFLGKVLVVTDDGVYRRFSEDYSSKFSVGNSDFMVVPVIDDKVMKTVESVESLYEFVVYITTNELPQECDKIVYCRGVDKGILTQETMKVLEKKEFTEAFVTFSRVAEPTSLKIEPSKGVMSYIFECEDKKEFVPTTDSSHTSMLEKFFEKELGVPKNTIRGLMQRKE